MMTRNDAAAAELMRLDRALAACASELRARGVNVAQLGYAAQHVRTCVLDLCSVPGDPEVRAAYDAHYAAARDAADPSAIAAFVAVLRCQWGVLDGGMAPTADAPALADPLVATIETLEQHRQRHAPPTPWAPALADTEDEPS